MNQSLPPPTSIKSFILSELIKGHTISEKELNWNSFRSRLSELNQKITIAFKWVEFKNSFGHPGRYRVHFLEESEKEKAVKLYKKLVDGNKENIHRVA